MVLTILVKLCLHITAAVFVVVVVLVFVYVFVFYQSLSVFTYADGLNSAKGHFQVHPFCFICC